jgi:hypothetical protein
VLRLGDLALRGRGRGALVAQLLDGGTGQQQQPGQQPCRLLDGSTGEKPQPGQQPGTRGSQSCSPLDVGTGRRGRRVTPERFAA